MVKKNAGLSLIEVMMVVAIIGIVVSLAPQILTLSTKFFILGKTRLQLQQEARAVMYVVTRELRQAQSNTIVIDQITGEPYYSRIRFTKAQGVNVTVAQSGTSLLLTEGVDVSTMTQNLAYLAFSFPESDDMTIVSVALTLQQQIYNGLEKALHMSSERVRVMD